jgi:hypothetical protein
MWRASWLRASWIIRDDRIFKKLEVKAVNTFGIISNVTRLFCSVVKLDCNKYLAMPFVE